MKKTLKVIIKILGTIALAALVMVAVPMALLFCFVLCGGVADVFLIVGDVFAFLWTF